MTAFQMIFALFLPKPETHETVEAKLENVVFDLNRATKENLAVSKMLNDVLTAR